MVKILDFGIAKETGKRRVVDGETTSTGQVLGSPHYMSPEHARGLPVDGRSDLWSLAVILYRVMTGERPFDGHDIGDLIVRICTDPVPKASSLQPELGPSVDAFFDKAFERDPAQRFQDAAAFADAFREALAEHILAERSGAWEARMSQTGPTAPASMPSNSGQMGTPTSSRFRAFAMGELGNEDEFPTRTPGDTFAAATAAPRSGRRLVGRLVGAAVVLLVGGVGAFFVFGSDEPPTETSAATQASAPTDAEAEADPAASGPPSATEEPPPDASSQETPEDDEPSAEASASASASAAPAPTPVARPRPRPVRPRPVSAPKPKPTPKPTVDLGY
jgi:serine/threonine-protein kinase